MVLLDVGFRWQQYEIVQNGSQIASASISTTRTPVCANDCKLVVGIIVDGDGSITSRARSQVLGETRIYDNNLTAAQVLSNYNARSARYGL